MIKPNSISTYYPVFALSLLGFLFSPLAYAETLSLTDIFRQAEQNDPQWAAFQFDIQSQQEILPQARAGLLPSFSVSARTVKKDQTYDVATENYDANENGYQATISQPIFHLDSWYQYKHGKSIYQQLDNRLSSERQYFILRVLEAYLSVLRANEELAFAEAESSAVARQLEQTKQRFDVGLIAITDVHESQAAFDLTKVNLLVAQNQVAIAYESLTALTGSDINAIQLLGDKYPIGAPAPNQLDHWLNKALERNPELLAARAAQKAARYNNRKALSAYAPDISLAATYDHTSGTRFTSNFTTPESDTATLALQLTWTPYQGGSILSAKKQASLQLDQSQAELSATQRKLTQRIQNAFRSVNTDVLRVKARQQAIKSSKSALDAVQSGYEVGTRNIVDVLQAQRGLFAAKRDYANTRYDYVVNLFTLKQLAGELSSMDIDSLNSWFVGP